MKEHLVSIIIPCLNEKETILKAIEEVKRLPFKKEIVVVDNGSQDGTLTLLKEFSMLNPDLKVLCEPRKGKGNALKKGIENSSGDYVVFQDADLEYSPKSIQKIVTLLEDYEAVVTRRICYPYSIKLLPFIANKFILFLFRKKYGKVPNDVFTGQRGFRRSTLLRIPICSEGFEVETELTAKMLALNVKFAECDTLYKPRSKKIIGFKDFIKILHTFFRIALSRKPLDSSQLIVHPEVPR